MGQLVHLLQHNNSRDITREEALNNQTNLDDLTLNLESFQGGLDCNVDEVRNLHPHLFFHALHVCTGTHSTINH